MLVPTYRSDEEGMRRRAAEADEAKKRAQAEREVDAALARAVSDRARRQHERGVEVEAGRDRLARIFGAIALVVGATILVLLVVFASEPGRMPSRLVICMLGSGLAPTAWGIIRLARGAARHE